MEINHPARKEKKKKKKREREEFLCCKIYDYCDWNLFAGRTFKIKDIGPKPFNSVDSQFFPSPPPNPPITSLATPVRATVRDKYRLRGREKRSSGGSNVRRMALIRPAIKLGLHWIGRTVCPELNGYT